MSSSNVYKKVDKSKGAANASSSSAEIQKNEVRITAQGRSRNYISYAVGLLDPSLLQKEEARDVQHATTEQFDTVVLKAMGKAIQKAVTIAEVLKRRVAGLHQITSIESQEIEDQYEPNEEGMDVITKKRTVSSIVIKLSKKALDTSDLGYQPPIPADQVTAPQIISVNKRVPGTSRVPTTTGGANNGEGGNVGGEGGAGTRRRRRFRSGATRKQQRTGGAVGGGQQQQTTTPQQPTQPTQQQQPTQQGGQQQEGGAAAQRGKSRTRGGRGRGRGGNTRGGGRGQPRRTNPQSTGGAQQSSATTTQQ